MLTVLLHRLVAMPGLVFIIFKEGNRHCEPKELKFLGI